MCEIKFRGKRQWNGEWLVGNLIIDKHGKKYIVPYKYFEADGHHLIYEDDTDTPVFIDQESVGQFTGLSEHGVGDWYHHDIITDRKRNYLIEWSDDELTWILTNPNMRGTIRLSDINSRLWHKIGNNHDNPELLNPKEASR